MYTFVSKLDSLLKESVCSGILIDKNFLIVAKGSTGAGKSTLAKKSAEHLRSKKFVNIRIDDLVENDKLYKEKVNKIIQEYRLGERYEELLLHPTNELLEDFGDAYISVRKELGCQEFRYERKIGKDDPWSCDKENNAKLADALRDKQNIVFETTGTYIPFWLYDMARLHKYEIVVAYSLVNFCDLVKRNKSRAATMFIAYMRDRQNTPAPRLPDVKDDAEHKSFRKLYKKIRDVLNQLLKSCVTKDASKECPVDRILLFDNNGTEMRMVYEYKRGDPVNRNAMKELNFLLNKLLFLKEESC